MKTGILVFLIFCTTVSRSQEQIETDRPDQTENAFLVPNGWFQQEYGTLYLRERSGERTLYHPSLLSKYGLGNVELRLITEWCSVRSTAATNGSFSHTGFFPLGAGVKLALWKEKAWWPQASVIIQSAVPGISSKIFRPDHWSPEVRFTFRNALGEVFSLGYNAGAERNEETGRASWLYTFAPAFSISDKWNGYVELFGFLERGQGPQHSFDGGLAYLFSNHTQLDLSAGKGLTIFAPDYYISLGFSYRVH